MPSSARLPRFMASLLPRRAKDAADGPRQCVPLARLELELFPALWCQSIELGAPIVLGRTVVEGDPAALDQPVKRRIERTLLDQQHLLRAALDRLGDGMAVRRTETQRAQNQEIQSSLQDLDARVTVFGRHSR